MRDTFQTWVKEYDRAVVRLTRSYERNQKSPKSCGRKSGLRCGQVCQSSAVIVSRKPWFFRIASNKAATHVSKQIKENARHFVPDDLRDLRDELDVRQRLEQIHRWLTSLNVLDRQVMTLTLEGLSHKDISEITGLSVSHVATKISRLRKQAREEGL